MQICYFVSVKVSQMQHTVVIETRQTTEVNQSSLILDFDRSVAELRDWLTLLERMLKSQRVTVGDISDIEQTIMKQKVYPRDIQQLMDRYPACIVLFIEKKEKNLTPNEIYLNEMSIFFFTVLWMFIIFNFFSSITCTHQMSFALCGRLSASAVRVWIWRSTIWARSILKLCMHWSVIFMSNFWSLRSVLLLISL